MFFLHKNQILHVGILNYTRPFLCSLSPSKRIAIFVFKNIKYKTDTSYLKPQESTVYTRTLARRTKHLIAHEYIKNAIKSSTHFLILLPCLWERYAGCDGNGIKWHTHTQTHSTIIGCYLQPHVRTNKQRLSISHKSCRRHCELWCSKRGMKQTKLRL